MDGREVEPEHLMLAADAGKLRQKPKDGTEW